MTPAALAIIGTALGAAATGHSRLIALSKRSRVFCLANPTFHAQDQGVSRNASLAQYVPHL